MNPKSTQASSGPQTPRESTSKYQQKLQEINQHLSDTYSSPNKSEDEDDNIPNPSEHEEDEAEEQLEEINKSEPLLRDDGNGGRLYDLPAPINREYPSKEAMLSSIKAFTRTHRYVIFICCLHKDKRIVFKCDQYDYLIFIINVFVSFCNFQFSPLIFF